MLLRNLQQGVLRHQVWLERHYGLPPIRLREMPDLLAGVALLSVEEVAVVLGVSRKIVDQHIHAGELLGVRVGNSRKFRLSDIQDFQERQAGRPNVVSLAGAKVRKQRAQRKPSTPVAISTSANAELDCLLALSPKRG